MNNKSEKKKIAIIPRGFIPSNAAHSINTMKHANGFFKLDYNVEVLALESLLFKKRRMNIKSIHEHYGISKSIKIVFFKDYSIQNFKNIQILQLLILKLFPYFENPLNKETELDIATRNRKFSNLIGLTLSKFLKLILKLISVFNSYNQVSKYCRLNNIELIYCRPYEVAYYCIKNKIPTIVETHWPNINNPEFRKFLSYSKNKFFKGIVTIHSIIKRKLITAGIPEEKILVMEDAVDLEKYSLISNDKNQLRAELLLPQNKKIIEYTGGLMNGRGIDTILEAANLLRDNNLVFYIIGGSKSEIEKWKRYLEKNQIRSEINFLGFIENKKIPLFHKAADILLAPYSIKCDTVEWMSPIKIFEYMASQVPIIASDVVRMKEICNNNECLFFKADDAKDLSNKIAILIKDKDLQAKLVQNAYQKSKEHTYRIRCARILKMLED